MCCLSNIWLQVSDTPGLQTHQDPEIREYQAAPAHTGVGLGLAWDTNYSERFLTCSVQRVKKTKFSQRKSYFNTLMLQFSSCLWDKQNDFNCKCLPSSYHKQRESSGNRGAKQHTRQGNNNLPSNSSMLGRCKLFYAAEYGMGFESQLQILERLFSL